MPEYTRGKRLVTPPVRRLITPWTKLLEAARKEKVKLNNDFLKTLNSKLPPKGRDLLVSRIEHEKKAAAIANTLQAANVNFSEEGKLVYTDPDKKKRENKKIYSTKEKDLLERMKSMNELKADPKLSPEYIRLRKDLHDFQENYGHAPGPKTPEASLKRLYQQDRWKNPVVRGPQNVPIIMPPEGETKGPYAGGREFTDEERKKIEEIMKRRQEEWGPAGDETGTLSDEYEGGYSYYNKPPHTPEERGKKKYNEEERKQFRPAK